MNEDTTKKKVKKRLSLRISSANMFPIYSRGIKGDKGRPRWKKSTSASSLRHSTSGRKLAEYKACSPRQTCKVTVTRSPAKTSKIPAARSPAIVTLGRSLSQRFESFRKRKEVYTAEKKFVKNDSKDNRDINVGGIGLKKQISRNLRRTLVRKYKSVLDFRNSRNSSSGKPPQPASKSCSDVRRGGHNKLFSSIQVSGKDISFQVKSRFDSTAETVDLATLTKMANISKPTINGTPVANPLASKKSSLQSDSAPYVDSPTCSDPFGIDEEGIVLESRSIQNMLQSPLANGIEVSIRKHCIEDVNCNQVRKSSESRDADGNPLKRRSTGINAADLVCKESHCYDNPWVLQEETEKVDESPQTNTPQEVRAELISPDKHWLTPQTAHNSVSGYNSFGFDVANINENEYQTDIKRSDSWESLDSFGSGVHSVQSQELVFSDSEAENDLDRLSISSTDSGTFETQLLSEKSFDSDLTQGNNADNGSNGSENKENIIGTPKARSRRKHGISMDDGSDLSGKIARKLFGQQVSVETAIDTRENLEKEKPNKEMTKRRSFDSNMKIKQMTLELDPASESRLKWAGSSDSGLSSALSPVFEADTKSKLSRSAGDDDSKKYFTLPNPRKKTKASRAESPKKRVSLGSLSKKISEKAQSLSNIKLGSSFKIRNEDKEESKLQTFLKTNSWTNLVVKKGAEVASNFSTLMRKRTNSNSAVSSPFTPRSRKARKEEEEVEHELVCETVKLYAPKKRRITSEEINMWKKRLKLNIEIAQNRNIVSGIRSRTNSVLGRPNSSNSLSPIYSPTLLDEIMKSVERVRFDSLRGSMLTDLDISDDDDEEEDSSSGGSPVVFCSQHSEVLASSVVKSDYLSMCKTCGKPCNNSSVGNGLVRRRNAVRRRNTTMSRSLCDLHGVCNCHKDRLNSRYRNGMLLDLEGYNTGSDKSLMENSDTESASSLDIMCNKLGYNKARRHSSMLELRNIEEVLVDTGRDDSDKLPGALLRHQPVLNLSDDKLDQDRKHGVVKDTCSACKNLASQGKCCVRDRDNLGMLSPDSQLDAETPETYHSCSELAESESSPEVHDETDYKKSHSCGNLVDEADVFIGDKLKAENDVQNKKEIRKAKVKSLSSSHDALSTFVEIEDLDIAKDIEDVVKDVEKTFGDKNVESNVKKTSSNASKTNEDANKISDSNIKNLEVNPAESNFSDNEKCDSTKTVNDSCKQCENCTEHSQTCAICEKLRTQDEQLIFKKPQNLTVLNDNVHVNDRKRSNKTLGKPPLPRKERSRKVLSMNDVSSHENKLTQSSDIPKRHSVNAGTSYSVSSLPPLGSSSNGSSTSTVREVSCSAPNTPLSHNSKSKSFDFNENHCKTYTQNTLTVPRLERLKSASSDNMNAMKKSQPTHERKWSGTLNPAQSDDVFTKAFSHSLPGSPGKPLDDGIPEFGFSESLPSSLFPDFPGPDTETVLKYDVGLGYLLHSVECDNQLICFYSFQRNKQLMESVITPLAALPGVTATKPLESTNVNKKHQKLKYDNQPNPAAPITAVPSEKLSHAGRVIRTVLLTRAPHLIRDRKFHLRTYRRCLVGTEMVDWLIQQSPLVHSRTQAVGMWQALLEEGVIVHVCHEHQFKDEYLFYRFHEDDEGTGTVPSQGARRECEDELQDVFLMLAQTGPDAMMRMILRKLPHERTVEDLEIIYEELLHIKALSHLSTMVKRELASVLVFESHAKSGTVLFNQGDEGKSWYIILKGSVNVVIYGKGVVCTLHEGDDFGKLALVNDAPRAATIVLRDDNCHFLRVDKDDFNRILRDVEANTVRLKEHGQDVLVLEKIPSNSQSADGTVHTHYKYSVMAGTPEKMLEYLLETRLDSKKEDEIDGFLEDFLLTHVIFMPNNHLCPVLLSHYHSSMADTSEQEAYEISLNHKKCVLHFVREWANTVGGAFKADQTINAFLEELHSCILEDLSMYTTLKDDVVAMETILQTQENSPDAKSKRKVATNFTLSRKQSKESQNDMVTKCKPTKPSDETIFKVYCADHTYSTLKLPMDTTVEKLLYSTKEKLGLGDDLVLCEVKSTGERIVFKENDLCVTSGLSINGRLFITPKEHLDALTPLPEQEGPSEGTFAQVEMISSRELAYCMTMYDWELFACVQEYELIYQVFGRYKFGKITANLDLFLRRFNEIQFWVVTEMVLTTNLSKRVSLLRKFIKIASHDTIPVVMEVVLTTNLSKRVSLLRKFIKIASHCKEYQNLNSFFAIVMGLSNIAVSRLSQTWEKLPGKFKKLFAEFETLMDPSRNHRVYRLSVSKMVPPIIPFMPLLMKDMTFTHEGNKTYFDGLVNFEKMHMISQTLKTVRFCRSANLDIEVQGSMKSADTANYIRNLHVIDNQRLLTKLSHKVEPRKT